MPEGPTGYTLHPGNLTVDYYMRLRADSGLTPPWMLDQIRQAAPPDAFVSLMADPPGRRLYASHGFTERRDLSIGMAMWLGREDGS